jgi:hypothetical protein
MESIFSTFLCLWETMMSQLIQQIHIVLLLPAPEW